MLLFVHILTINANREIWNFRNICLPSVFFLQKKLSECKYFTINVYKNLCYFLRKFYVRLKNTKAIFIVSHHQLSVNTVVYSFIWDKIASVTQQCKRYVKHIQDNAIGTRVRLWRVWSVAKVSSENYFSTVIMYANSIVITEPLLINDES